MGGYPGEVSPSQSFQSGAFWEYKLILGLGRSVNGQFVLAMKGCLGFGSRAERGD